MCNFVTVYLALSAFIQLITGQGDTVEMEVYAQLGTSVQFYGVSEDQRGTAEVFLWEMISGNAENGTKMGVLKFHAGAREHSLTNKYIGRLDFALNGSFILHNLTPKDEGLYILTINLSKVQSVRLRIIDALSKASILFNSSSLHSTIQLTCDVFGNPHVYQWQKGGGEISQNHRLINGNRSLIIPDATKDDCGTFTCVAINPISSIQANYTLTFPGIPQEEIVILDASIVGLIFSAISFIGLILLCCLAKESNQAPLRQPKLLFLGLLSSNTLSLVAIFIALTSWIVVKGATSVPVAALCTVSVLLILAVTETIAIWNLGCPCVWTFLKKTGFRALIDLSGMMSSFIVMVISIVILLEEIQQNSQGCHITILTWNILIALFIVCVMIFAISFAIWRCKDEDTNSDANNQQAEQNNGELQQLNGIIRSDQPS
ncbi:carcinoembryonic antigen-related cell adhesion molecule 1-like [Heptranchias perlo]|uniref:carcinoembryonic antigen-related cell adhesion molecule 1-like n=1 Tax=Heptranchias perlo TaxID=212740 RepID=UPI00355A4951